MTVVNELMWRKRKIKTRAYTNVLMRILLFRGHFERYREATLEEDRELGIDYWVLYPGQTEWVPIQFKLRSDPTYRDIAIELYYNFPGLFSPNIQEGRDFENLKADTTLKYYVAFKNSNGLYSSISISDSSVLKEAMLEIHDKWIEEKGWNSKYRSYEKGSVIFHQNDIDRKKKYHLYLDTGLQEQVVNFTAQEIKFIEPLAQEEKVKLEKAEEEENV
jgi:hypothetical protein